MATPVTYRNVRSGAKMESRAGFISGTAGDAGLRYFDLASWPE
jgi:hypothetical protein